MVFEAEASGGGSKAGGLPHPSLSPFPPLLLSVPPKFSDKPVGRKVRSSEGEVPRLPSYKYHRAYSAQLRTGAAAACGRQSVGNVLPSRAVLLWAVVRCGRFEIKE